jgi:hypothetical protein
MGAVDFEGAFRLAENLRWGIGGSHVIGLGTEGCDTGREMAGMAEVY